MKWPWKSDNLEYRAAAYTDALIALVDRTGGRRGYKRRSIRRRGARGRQWACGAGLCYRVGGYHVQRGDAGLGLRGGWRWWAGRCCGGASVFS